MNTLLHIAGVKETLLGVTGLLLQIAVGFAPIFVVKGALAAKAGLGKIAGKLDNGSKGLIDRSRKFGQGTNFYQRRELARNSRDQERKRGNVADYANRVTGTGVRAALLRRRAAGGVAGQVLNTNKAGQQRAYVGGLSQVEKQEHEEAAQGALVLEHNQVNAPAQLAAVAAGRTGTGIAGQTVSGTGNRALQLAAIQKLIKAQDAEQLENLFQDGGVDHQMLVGELTKEQNYSTSKGAGAHFVQMEARQYTRPEIDRQAVTSLSNLSADKLATQDGPSWHSARNGFVATTGDPTTLDARQRIWDQVQAIHADPRAENNIKGSARAAYDAILAVGSRPTV